MLTDREALKRIAAAYETRSRLDDGAFESTHAKHNLEGALIDMRHTGKLDAICENTIQRVIGQLLEIERALKEAGL